MEMNEKFLGGLGEYIWCVGDFLAVILSPEGAVRSLNQYAKRKLREGAEAGNARDFLLFLPGDWDAKSACGGEKPVLYSVDTRAGEPENFRCFFVDGGEEVLLLGQAEVEDAGRNAALLADLTGELTAVSRQLEKKNAELEKMNELKNEFMGLVAHDLRSPLSNIFSLASMIADSKERLSFDVEKGLLDSILDQSKSMIEMVGQLLDVGAIQSGVVRLNLRNFNPLESVHKTVLRYRIPAKRKEIALRSSFPQEALMLAEGDALKFQQVLDSVCSNAIKFSHPGGTVTFRSWWDELNFYVSVEDEGVGIAPLALQKIFSPFSLVPSVGTGGEKGAGLGLPLAQKIMKAHGGAIGVESTLGGGSIFTVVLPFQAKRMEAGK